MNSAQFHLLLNHLPVIIPILGAPILVVGILTKSSDTQKVGLCLLILSALIAIPTYLTGGPAQRLIKNYPNVSRLAISEHEEAAQLSLIAIEIVGAISLLLLVWAQLGKQIPRTAWATVLFLSVSSTGLIVRTAHLGGQIRHEEIQSEKFLRATR